MAKECINRLILYRHNHFYSFKMILTQATLDIKLRYDGSIFIDNTEPLVFKKTPTKLDAFDVAQSDKYNQYGDYVFRSVVETKTGVQRTTKSWARTVPPPMVLRLPPLKTSRLASLSRWAKGPTLGHSAAISTRSRYRKWPRAFI